MAKSTAFYRNRRQKIIDYMGGCCSECGGDGTDSKLMLQHDSLELRPSFSFSHVTYMAWGRLEVMLADAELLCAQCYREINGTNVGTNQVEHGGGDSGKHNCKCQLCKDKKNAYMRDWRKTHKYVRVTAE